MPFTFKKTTTGQLDLESESSAGIEPRGSEDMYAAQADIGAASERRDFFPVRRPKPSPRVKRDSLAGAAG